MNKNIGIERLKFVLLVLTLIVGGVAYLMMSISTSDSALQWQFAIGMIMAMSSGFVPYLSLSITKKIIIYITLFLVGLTWADKGVGSALGIFTVIMTLTGIGFVIKWVIQGFREPG